MFGNDFYINGVNRQQPSRIRDLIHCFISSLNTGLIFYVEAIKHDDNKPVRVYKSTTTKS